MRYTPPHGVASLLRVERIQLLYREKQPPVGKLSSLQWAAYSDSSLRSRSVRSPLLAPVRALQFSMDEAFALDVATSSMRVSSISVLVSKHGVESLNIMVEGMPTQASA